MMNFVNSIQQLFSNSQKTQKAFLKSPYPRISELLPYQIYDEVEGLYINDNSYGFLLEVTPLCGATHEIVNILTGMFTDGVPEGCAIQVMNWASPKVGEILKTWQVSRSNVGGIHKKIAEKRIDYYQGKNWESLLKNPFIIRNYRVFIAVSLPINFGEMGKKMLLALREQLKTTLESSGMRSWEILPNAFLNLLTELINPQKDMSSNKKKWNGIDPLKDHLSDYEQVVEISPNGITLENNNSEKFEVRNFTVRDFPEIWTQWNNRDLLGDFYSDYLRIPCPVLTTFSFIYENENKSANRATFKSLRATQQAGSGIAKFMPSIHEVERDWKFVADKISKGQKLVKAFFQVTIYGLKDEIENCERYIRSLYKSKQWNLQKDKFVQLQTWLVAMPFMISEGLRDDLKQFGRFKSMVTWSCANLAPLQGEWKGMKTPRVMLLGRRGQPFFWDPFDNDNGNYNVAVVGKAGSGKSMFMQELVSLMLGGGGQVIVIDDGRSFMNSCLMQGGAFVEFSGESNLCLNPFSIISEADFERRPDYKEEVLHLLNLIIRQMTRAVEPTSDIENAFISEAINFVWTTYRRDSTITKVAEFLLNHKDKRAKDLGIMLNPFTAKGLYTRFFEGKANISLDNSFFVFEFDKIKNKPDLQRIVLMVLIFLVSEKMFHGDRVKTVSLVIDEAWSLLHGSHFAAFIEGVARRARKHNGNLITGTQSIEDYYKNPAATAAIQNTDWYCLLSQTEESIQMGKESGRIIMDAEKEKALKSLMMVNRQYSEIMICGSSTGWAVGRLILDPYSIALYSSKGEDFARIQALRAQGLSLEEALEQSALTIQGGKI